jgi:hypothetical protein
MSTNRISDIAATQAFARTPGLNALGQGSTAGQPAQPTLDPRPTVLPGIDDIVDIPDLFDLQRFRVSGGLLRNVSPVVEGVQGSVNLAAGESLAVEVAQTAIPTTAAATIDFHSQQLNLGGILDNDGVDEQLIIVIEGSQGTREFSFASGTVLSDIAHTIDSLARVTGVAASVDGTELRLQSTEVGSAEFVSVVILDDGALVPSPSAEGISSAALISGFKYSRSGTDIAGTINGIEATGNGRTLTATTADWNLSVTLSLDAALTGELATPFQAFEVFQPRQQPKPLNGGIDLSG